MKDIAYFFGIILMENLTINKDVWNTKWKSCLLPKELDGKQPSDRSLIKLFEEFFEYGYGQKTILEVGCSPGRFLIYFGKYLGYQAHGIEYSEEGVRLTMKNCELSGVQANIIHSDFLTYRIEEQFDCVVSAGFVEHFTSDLEIVLEKHANLVKPGGKLFLSFPNFQYLNYFFAWFCRRDILRAHNCSIMNKEFFVDFSQKYGFEIKFLQYFGGVNPRGVKLSDKLGRTILGKGSLNAVKLLEKIRQLQFWDSINSKWFSHYLGAILVKKT